MIKRILLGCAVMAVSSAAFADVVIRNGSNYEITEVYVAPHSIQTWGPDHLGENMLKPSDSLTLKGVAPGTWDFRIVFREAGGKESWPCVIPGIELGEAGDDSTFDEATLDKCAEHTDESGGEEEGEE